MLNYQGLILQKILLISMLSAFVFAPAAFADSAQSVIKSDLEVVVDGIHNSLGNVRVAVFSDADASLFPDHAPPLKQSIPATGQPVTLHFDTLAAGRYAVLAFHDENSNAILDKNFLGVPSERWGATGKRPFGRKPIYMESVFEIDSEHHKITLHLE